MAVMSSKSRACPRTINALAHDQCAARLAGPRRQPRFDHPRREIVELGALQLQILEDETARLLEGTAGQTGIEIVAGLGHGRSRHAERHVDQPVLDMARLGDRHDQGAAGTEIDELDVLQRLLGLGRHDHAGTARQARQQGRGLFQRLGHAAADGRAARLDALALLFGDVADLEQAVDEQPQAGIGRQAAGGGVRRVKQPDILQIGHDVADGGGRQGFAELAGECARADRLAGLDIALDHQPQDLTGTLAQLGHRSGLPLALGSVAENRRGRTDTVNCHGKNVGSTRGGVNAR